MTVFYHGTSTRYLERILSLGLLESHWTRDWSVAVHFAEHMREWEWDLDEDVGAVVFEVPESAFEGLRRVPDLNMIIFGAVHEKEVDIRAAIEEAGIDLRDWKPTFGLTGTFRMLDPVPVTRDMIRPAIRQSDHYEIVARVFRATDGMIRYDPFGEAA